MSHQEGPPVDEETSDRDRARARKEKVERLEGRAAELTEQIAHWKGIALEQRARTEELQGRVRHLEARLHGLKERAARTHRQLLSADVVRTTMPVRARTTAARAAIPPREMREAALRDISPAYVTAAREGPAIFGDQAHRMQVQTLAWWMPVTRPRPAGVSEAWLAKQHFPYRAIVQTRELSVGGIMLDLGANTGRMSISRVVLGDVVAAYCAEPEPLNYACLVGNVIDNDLAGLVLPDQVAIGDVDGTVTLRVTRTSGGHSIVRGSSTTPVAEVVVPSVRLDTWLDRLRVEADAVSFVKVDVQGYEGRVLRGAPRLLAKPHVAWQIEVDPALLAAAGTPVPDLIAVLQKHFTHFIDLNAAVLGERARPSSQLAEALAYLAPGETNHTDLLVFRAEHLAESSAGGDAG